MTALQSARKAVVDAQNRFTALEAERDQYSKRLEVAEERERVLRRERTDLTELTAVHAEINALRSVLTQVGEEISELAPKLTDLEVHERREELTADRATVGAAIAARETAIRKILDSLTTVIRPALEKLRTEHGALEEAHTLYASLGVELHSEGGPLPAVATPLQMPIDADVPTRRAWAIYSTVAAQHTADAQRAAEEARREAEGARQRQREAAERDAEPLAFALLERHEEALARLGSLVVGSRPVAATAHLPENIEIYIARRNTGQLPDLLKGLRYMPLGEART